MSRRLCLIVLVAAGLIAGCGGGDDAGGGGDRDAAIAEAQEAFDQARTSGRDLSSGPCLAESLTGLPDWVADIAHDPREDADDDPGNQCRRFREGEAHHFVELTPEGELIRAE